MSGFKFDYLKATRGMPPGPRVVLMEIWNHSDEYGENAFPSVETLMVECAMKRRTVERHLKWLRDNGWITQVRRGGRSGDNHTWSSAYSLSYGTIPGETTEVRAEVTPVDLDNPETVSAVPDATPDRDTRGTTESPSALTPEATAVPSTTDAPICNLCDKPVTNDAYEHYRGTWHRACLQRRYPDVDLGPVPGDPWNESPPPRTEHVGV